MSKQTYKMNAEHKSQINLEDLPLDEAQQDDVKAGSGRKDINDVYVFSSPTNPNNAVF